MFALTREQAKRLDIWRQEQDAQVVEEQKKERLVGVDYSTRKDVPYYGVNGGGYTYSFTPTTLGMIVKVKNELTGEVLDVSHLPRQG